MSGSRGLQVERDEGVVTLTLQRPERRNAIDVPLWQALAGELGAVAVQPGDRAVVLTGADGNFCAGGDLSGSAPSGPPPDDAPQAAVRIMRETVGAACLALHRLPQPVIAAVEGSAAGAGANLAFGCDLVIAGASARFGEVFVRRALPVDSGGTWLLPRLVGLQRAKELAFFGGWLPAEEAERIGLVNRTVPDGDALGEAQRWARRLAASSPHALAHIKRGVNAAFEVDLERALESEARALAECVGTEEFAEAMRAFLGRRRS